MLKAEQLDMVRCWPDKRDSLLHAGSGKSDVLAQESITGMNGIGSGLTSNLQNKLSIDITLFGRAFSYQYRFICNSTCRLSRSAVVYTATDEMPMLRKVRIIRTAIAPRLAIRILLNIPFTPSSSQIRTCAGVGL